MKEETTNGGEGSKNGGRKWRTKSRNSDRGGRVVEERRANLRHTNPKFTPFQP